MAAAPPPPMALPPATFPPPQLGIALRNQRINIVDEHNILHQETVYLIENTNNPPARAYLKWPKPSIPLNGERGEILYCQVLLRDQSSPTDINVVFRKSETTVLVKKLRRWIIDPPLLETQAQGGEPVNENPYNEVHVMQQYGNLENIMTCYDALWDEHFLYIIMLYVREGDLFSHVQPGLGGGYQPFQDIPLVFKKLVKNLDYLQQYRLVHRDLKPENTMVRSPHFLWIDFAMTLQRATLEGVPQDIEPPGAAGSPCYISPEVFSNHPFNNKADIWALGCILWNLLTGIRLYRIPLETDESYFVMIVGGGLVNEALCERVLQELLQRNATGDLMTRLQAVQILSPIARDLLSKLLEPNPAHRLTLSEILQHDFFHE